MTTAEDFWAKVDLAGPLDCWTWRGATVGRGEKYGQTRWGADGRREYAHRVAYILDVGPIGHGLVIDHLCRNRRCVNPRHLEVVTQRINILRGNGACARRYRRARGLA